MGAPMPLPLENSENRIIIKFGAGINTVASPADIAPMECADGSKNFNLKLDNTELRRRSAFDLVATATNGESINGYAQLEKQDGTLSTLIQAGGTVYEWDGTATGFTSVGAVNSGAKLRGPRQTHNFTLDEKVIITDLSLVQVVMEWDGTTFQAMSTNLATDFFAKYLLVHDERGFFANVIATTATPHMIVGSKLSDINTLSVTDRPSSALNVEDPFFLLTPDLRPVNFIVEAFGLINFSSREGRIFKLSGTDAKDFSIAELYANSGAVGDEAMAFIGNDVAYGRAGKIETLFATDRLGDVATDDLSRWIANLVTEIDDWAVIFNPRFQKIYFFSNKQEFLGVFQKDFIDENVRRISFGEEVSDLSPWSIYETTHPLNFQPITAWVMRRPTDGLETTYMGGPDGAIYEMEGNGGQDGGTDDINVVRLSKMFEGPPDSQVSDVNGWLSFRPLFQETVNYTLEFSGRELKEQGPTALVLTPSPNAPVFGGAVYFGGLFYFGQKYDGRYTRKTISSPGSSEVFQVRLEAGGAKEFIIQEAGFEFVATT